MAELSGENGAIYYNEEKTSTVTSGNLFFSTGGFIISSGALINFETAGYVAGMLITIDGCTKDVVTSGVTTENNRTYTLTNVSSGVLTVNEEIAAPANPDASTEITLIEEEPGIAVLGFYNWTVSYASDTLEVTNFDNSSGGRNYISGIKSWTVTADKHFLTSVLTSGNEVNDWVGKTCEIRCFLNYVATPASTNSSQYWKGDTIVTGIDETVPVDAIISQSLSFQGDGALTLKTQTDPWSCGISV